MNRTNSSVLIKNASFVATMDEKKRILVNVSLYIEGSQIREVETKRMTADRVIDARGCVVIPGFINCHHHMFQCTLRCMPQLQNQTIEKWIRIVCKTVKKMDDEMIYYSALANMAELLLYGCTTSTDMLYIFPRNTHNFFEATLQAARDIGIRFHPYRGSMSLSRKDGALFPNDVVQDSDIIAQESERIIRKYNDSSVNSKLRIGLAPCALFSNTSADYKNAHKLAKQFGINVQTHLSESRYESFYSLKTFKKRPMQYLMDCGWVGPQVSFVHCIDINQEEIEILARTKTNVVHCPISNARAPRGDLGIAPIWEMLRAGVNVGVGVDGSAGNDSSNMLEELRWVRTLQGIRKQSTYLKAYDVLQMGTINAARLLNWEKAIGSIEEGKEADIAIFSRNSIESVGSQWDSIGSLVSTQAVRAKTVLVGGTIVVENGQLQSFPEDKIIRESQRRFKTHDC